MKVINVTGCCECQDCPDESECSELPSTLSVTLSGVSGGSDCPDISGTKVLEKQAFDETDGCHYYFYQVFGTYPDPQWDLMVELICHPELGGWVMTIVIGGTGGMFYNGVTSCTWYSDARAPSGEHGGPPAGVYVFDNPPDHHPGADCTCGYPSASLGGEAFDAGFDDGFA